MAFGDGVAAVLGKRDFRRLYATRLVGQTADGVFQVGLANFVLFSPERHTSPGQTAAALATLLLPYSIVGPFAGVFIDRWSRQRILLVANVVRAVFVVGVAALVASGVDGPAFYAGTLAVLSVNRFILSALSAALPHVLDDELLVTGNSLSTTSGTLVAILGGGVGLAVREIVGATDGGTALVMLGACAGYLGAALTASRIDVRLLGPDHDPRRPETVEALRRVAAGIVDGARHVRERPNAARALTAITAHRFFYGLSTIATLLLYRHYFEDGTLLRNGLGGLSQVFALSGLGFMLAAVATPVAVRRIGTERWMVGCFALAAAAELALCWPFRKAPYLLAALVLGFVAQAAKICVDTTVQREMEDDFRGRVFSFYDIVFNVGFVTAAVVAAAMLPPNGKSYVVVSVVAAGYLATALGFRAATRRAEPGSGPPRSAAGS